MARLWLLMGKARYASHNFPMQRDVELHGGDGLGATFLELARPVNITRGPMARIEGTPVMIMHGMLCKH